MKASICLVLAGFAIAACGDDSTSEATDGGGADTGSMLEDSSVRDASMRDASMLADAGESEDDASAEMLDASSSDDAGQALDSGASDCDLGTFAVTINGTAQQGCIETFHQGGLNHAMGRLQDGRLVIVNFNGQVAADDVCQSITVRKAGGASTDWSASTANCDVDVSEYGASGGGRVQATFSATAAAAGGNTDPALELTNGSFDALRP